MSDLVTIVQGSSPWAPAPTTELILELDRYNFPRTGVARQSDGVLVLFDCISDVDDDQGAWIYATLTEAEVEELDRASSTDLARMLSAAFRHRWVTVAYVDDFRVVFSESFDVGDESYLAVLRRFASRLEARMNSMRSGVEHMTQAHHLDQPEIRYA